MKERDLVQASKTQVAIRGESDLVLVPYLPWLRVAFLHGGLVGFACTTIGLLVESEHPALWWFGVQLFGLGVLSTGISLLVARGFRRPTGGNPRIVQAPAGAVIAGDERARREVLKVLPFELPFLVFSVLTLGSMVGALILGITLGIPVLLALTRRWEERAHQRIYVPTGYWTSFSKPHFYLKPAGGSRVCS